MSLNSVSLLSLRTGGFIHIAMEMGVGAGVGWGVVCLYASHLDHGPMPAG